jgi:7,8-dihydroneopterin aldolase/epimerase/oxygenase
MQTELSLHGLRFKVKIGWTLPEQEIPQDIEVHVKFRFSKPPLACTTDQLSDTLCYDDVTSKMLAYSTSQSFHLVEYLACGFYNLLRDIIRTPNGEVRISVIVIKLNPPIAIPNTGASFSYGDF